MNGQIQSERSLSIIKQVNLLVIGLFLGTNTFSQHQVFDSIYEITRTETIYKEPDKALQNVDYLFSISSDIQNQIKSLFLKSEIFRISGLHSEAIFTLGQADTLINPEDHNNLLLINGLLATNYRESGQPFFSKKHLEKSLDIAQKIDDIDRRNFLMSSIYQEISYTYLEAKKYEEAILSIKNSFYYREKITAETSRLKFGNALNFQILGHLFLQTEQLDSALYYSNKAAEKLSQSASPSSSLRGYILKDLIDIAILSGDYKNIESLSEEAIDISKKANDLSLLKDIYVSKMTYYKKTENHSKYIEVNEEFIGLSKIINTNKQKARQDIYAYLDKTQGKPDSQKAKKTDLKYIYFIGCGILIISLIVYQTRKRNLFKTEQSLQFSKDLPTKLNGTNHLSKNLEKPDEEENSDKEQKEYLSEEVMQQILQKLKQLEKEEFYLDSNMSIGSLAAKVGVNHRYLSYTINRKFKKDYTTYINELRIEYIIKFLKENPQHLRYKISYLADKAGFSSHNRFSAIFKKIKGISPSELIQQLEEEIEQRL